MRLFPESGKARGSRTPHTSNAQSGHIELGSVFVIVAVLGVIAYMGITGTAWGDLSFLGKAVIVGIVAAAVFAAWIFNESSQWPNASLGSTNTPEKNSEAKTDQKIDG